MTLCALSGTLDAGKSSVSEELCSCARFYAALYSGIGVPEVLVIASAVSAFAVEGVGALNSIPTWDAVLEEADPYLGSIN